LVEAGQGRPPLLIHANDRLAYKVGQQLTAVDVSAYEVDLLVGAYFQAGLRGSRPKEVRGHVSAQLGHGFDVAYLAQLRTYRGVHEFGALQLVLVVKVVSN
jgi:hypothetical protein